MILDLMRSEKPLAQAFAPGFGISCRVHDAVNGHGFFREIIENCVWKSANEGTPESTVYLPTGFS